MKLLLSAFACDPVTGSEPYVGWNWAIRLHRRYDLTVLTRTYSARLIEQHGADVGLRLVHFDLPGCAGKDHYWKPMKAYYVIWQFCALFYVIAINLRRRFDFIHHLTYNVVDMPGYLAFVPGPRFIWGPVGGGQVPPESLSVVYGAAWKRQKLRGLAKRFVRINPLVVLSARFAAHVFYANRETAALISRHAQSWAIMLETAIDAPPLKAAHHNDQFEFLWLGNVIDRKALIIAIEALGQACAIDPDLNCRLVVAGDGDMLPASRQRAAELGIDSRIRFLGKVPFAQVMDYVEACDAFLFTSVQDTSGNVVLEAMSRGKPVICLDHQGAAEIVTDASGIKLPVADFTTVVDSFAQAILTSAHEPAAMKALGEGAYRQIVTHHRWDARIDAFAATLSRLATGGDQG